MDLRTRMATRGELAKYDGRPSDGHCELKSTVVNANLGDNVRAQASFVNRELINMNIAKRIAILLGPLVVIVILAFVFLDDDPAHDHRDYVMGQWIGFAYVAYVAVLAFRWSKRKE
jgi:hypothetical protein